MAPLTSSFLTEFFFKRRVSQRICLSICLCMRACVSVCLCACVHAFGCRSGTFEDALPPSGQRSLAMQARRRKVIEELRRFE